MRSMQRSRALIALLAWTLAVSGTAAAQAAAPLRQTVVAVEVTSSAASILRPAREAITIRAGDPYRIDSVRDSLQALWALGLIEDAAVHSIPEGDGVRLRFELQPKIRLWNVRFGGDQPTRSSRLRRALSLRPGQPLTDAEAARQAERVQQLLSDDGYLQARVTPTVKVLPGGTRGELELSLAAGTRSRLQELRLEGPLGIAPTQVRDALQLQIGDFYQPSGLEQALERLDALYVRQRYFYRQVRVEEQSLDVATGNMHLVLGVDSGPLVDLEMSGLQLSEAKQRQTLSIFEFGTVADWSLKESRHELVGLLQQRGHWRPLVSFGRERDADGHNIAVQIRVLAGEKRPLERVEFTGTATVDDAILRGAIRSGQGSLLAPARFVSEYWEQDQRAVLSVMRRHGYRNARLIDAPVTVTADGKLVARMTIDAGQPVLVSSVDLSVDAGNEPVPGISVPTWLEALELQPGGAFDAAAVRRDSDRLRALLASSGYERGSVETVTEESDGGVRMHHRINSGERARVVQVIVAGNEKTRTEVITRELAFLVGSPWTFSDMLESQSRLYRLGVFDEVAIQPTIPDPVTSQRAVAVRVHEAPPKFYSLGIGFDTEEKLRGSVALGHNNVLGRGEQLSLSTRLSTREQRVRLLFREPWFLGRRLDASATAFYTAEVEPSFDVQRLGGALQLLVQQSRTTSHFGRIAYRDVTTHDIKIDPDLIEPEDQATTVGSIGYTLLRDTRSDPIDPRNGSYHTLDMDVATRWLGSATDFVTVFGRSYWYRDVGGGVVVALAGRAGFKVPYASSTDVPLPERFFSGGSTSLRGFGLDEAGPLDSNGNPLGGEVILIANAELRVPLRGQFGAVLFADIGNVFAKPGDIAWAQVREMAGAGARFDTPVGPIRLDLAWLLDRRPGEGATQLFFSVGHTF